MVPVFPKSLFQPGSKLQGSQGVLQNSKVDIVHYDVVQCTIKKYEQYCVSLCLMLPVKLSWPGWRSVYSKPWNIPERENQRLKT